MELLNSFKTCPACRRKSLTLSNKKIITCQNCRFVYFHNTAAAVAAIIEHYSRILLVKRAKDPMASSLDLPGGFVDYNESAEKALIREVREELNIEIQNLKFLTSLPNIYIYKHIEYHVLDIFFTCRAVHIEDIKPNDEVTDFYFLKPQDIPLDEIAFESTKKALTFYQNNLPA